MMKKVLCMAMALLMLLGVLVACQKDMPTEDTSTGGATEGGATDSQPTRTEPSDTEEPVEYIDLVIDGKSQFMIVSNGEAYAKAADSLKTMLDGKTGVVFTVKRFDPSPDEAGKIYVGCDWKEVSGSEHVPKHGYYGVVWANGNLYLCGTGTTEVAQCVSVFASSITKDHMTKDADGKVQVTVPSTVAFLWEPDGGKVVTLLGETLQSYRIVHSAEASDVEQYFVSLLQEQLRKAGYDLSAVTDAQAPAEREIVVGNTTRAGSADFYGKSYGAGDYAIVGKGTSLYVGYGSILCLQDVLDGMTKIYDKDTVSIRATTTESTDHIQPKQATDIRVMTANIQYVAWDAAKNDHHQRMRMTAEYISLYQPDVIGMQEAIQEMRDALTPYLDECYEYVDFASYIGENEMVRIAYLPVLYNADEWTVLDAGTGDWRHAQFTAWGYNWVKFGRVGNQSEVFYLINLHYMPAHFLDKEGYGLSYGELYRKEMAGCVSDEVERIVAADPDAMIAITGDYNTQRGSDVFEVMYENGLLETSSLLTADTNMTQEWKYKTVDHVSVTKAHTEVVLHRELHTIGGEFMSDHYYAFADLRRKTT